MDRLFERITFEDKNIYELKDSEAIRAISMLAVRLQPLKEEILSDPAGQITITKDGNVLTDLFRIDIAAKIDSVISRK